MTPDQLVYDTVSSLIDYMWSAYQLPFNPCESNQLLLSRKISVMVPKKRRTPTLESLSWESY